MFNLIHTATGFLVQSFRSVIKIVFSGFIGISFAAQSVEFRTEVVVDYFQYFEDQEDAINIRELIQLRPSIEHELNSSTYGFVQIELKKDFADSRYDDARLFEAYFDIRLDNMDIRVGKHQVIWGKTDFFNPTDTLTPIDYTDFYDTEDRRQPIELLQSRVFFDGSELELLVQFGFEASYLPKSHSRWLPDLNQLTNIGELDVAQTSSSEPDDIFSSAGIKQSFFLSNFDFSMSYLYGWHSVSNADMATTVDELLIDYYYYKRHQFGTDFARNIGQVGIRGEVAYTHVIEDSEGNSRKGGYIQYVLGADKTFTNLFYGRDLYINLEVLGDNNVETDTFQRITLFDAFDLAVGLKLDIIDGYNWRYSIETIVNIEDHDYRIRPKVTYSPLDGLDMDFICDFGGGEDGTLYGMFEDNDRFQIRVTYAL